MRRLFYFLSLPFPFRYSSLCRGYQSPCYGTSRSDLSYVFNDVVIIRYNPAMSEASISIRMRTDEGTLVHYHSCRSGRRGSPLPGRLKIITRETLTAVELYMGYEKVAPSTCFSFTDSTRSVTTHLEDRIKLCTERIHGYKPIGSHLAV